jgi:hypothetical protein
MHYAMSVPKSIVAHAIVVFLLTFAFVIFLSKEILKVVYTKRSGKQKWEVMSRQKGEE